MRTLLLAASCGLGMTLVSPVMAQQGASPMNGARYARANGNWQHNGDHRQWIGRARHHWGDNIGGRWIGGARAPGGWGAYRRPVKGWAMPDYWLSPTFTITDWGAYGLSAPPYGYHWSRYYDDAVLVDEYGRSMDCIQGIDWDAGNPDGYTDRGDYAYDTSHDVGPGAGYAEPPRETMPPPLLPPMGRHAETRTYAYEGRAPVVVHSGFDCGCAGRVVDGWYYPPATVTTVTIDSVPVTTTRTEYVEERFPVVRPTKIVKRSLRGHKPTKIVRRYHTKLGKR